MFDPPYFCLVWHEYQGANVIKDRSSCVSVSHGIVCGHPSQAHISSQKFHNLHKYTSVHQVLASQKLSHSNLNFSYAAILVTFFMSLSYLHG